MTLGYALNIPKDKGVDCLMRRYNSVNRLVGSIFGVFDTKKPTDKKDRGEFPLRMLQNKIKEDNNESRSK